MTTTLNIAQKILSSHLAPFTFKDPGDYGRIQPGNLVHVSELREGIAKNELAAEFRDQIVSGPKSLNEHGKTPNEGILVVLRSDFSTREVAILLAGGLLNFTKKKSETNS